jgi:hypothetical protein
MKLFTILIVVFSLSLIFAQEQIHITFSELTLSAEKNPQQILDARKLAEKLGLPHTIYSAEGFFIEAKGIENNKVVYSIIKDMLHPFNNGEVAFWEEISARFDFTKARIHWTNRPTQNPELGYEITQQNNPVASFIMVLESTTDAVMTFNYNDGTLINAAYIPGGNPNLSTPIEPLLTPNSTILVSDQLTDNIVEFDTLGAFVRIFFGGNTAVLDNCRGIELRPGNTTLVAAIAGTTNQDAIAEFDINTGNYIGNFIAPNAAQLDGPWDIVFRATDCLVTGEASDNVVKYDLNGNYIGNFFSPLNFPEQLNKTASGNIVVAVFSTPSGLYVLDSTGAQLNYFSSVTGLRGAIQLGNGNYLITNGTGVYILDQNTGGVLSTPVAGVSGRSAHEYDLAIIPVELTSFAAKVVNSNVILNWNTATEINNSGFEIQRSSDRINFSNVAFVPGFGTTTEPRSYTYTDNTVSNGAYYYRLKQVDFNGAFAYSDIVEVDVATPIVFALEQNYPNPFNPSTVISYSIPQNSFVTLKVYDIIGNEVATLVNQTQSAGKYDVRFDASKLSNGVYFYTINANNFTSTRKMILMK